MPKFLLRLGSCAATTSCEICSELAKNNEDLSYLCPYDINHITKKGFINFDINVAKYLYPRAFGVDTTKKFVDGFLKYAKSVNINVSFDEFQSTAPFEEAVNFVIKNIDDGYPVAYLMLKHKNRKFNFFNWHWFTVTGYENNDNGFNLICATYGKRHVLPFRELYNTGYSRRGGMVVIK